MTTHSLNAAQAIRGAGLRVTAPRQAIYEVLAESHSHPDAERITASCRERLGSVSQQAVYDVLAAFEKADLIRCIDPAGSPAARYEIQTHDNHHHLVCKDCRQIVDVPCGAHDVPCIHPVDDHGFQLDHTEVVYWGLCRECQATHAAALRSHHQ